MAIDVSYRDTYTTSAEDLSRTNRNFIINEGVAFDGLKVTQSGTPGMSVIVAPGTGYFYGSGTNSNVMYEFYSDANEIVTIGASGVQARIDIICLKVDASTGVASIVAVAGTPSGSPAVPATPASHYKLAEVAVGISVTTITNANITDRRRSVFVAPTGARNQGLINGYIRATVASNNLTVAISTSPTSLVAPTETNPVGIWIGNNLRWITSALAVTANAGTNWVNAGSAELATREIDYFAYIGYNATDGITLGFARIPYARLYSDFNTTTTNERYARISTITNAAAGDNYVNIGRFAATLSAGAGHTWTVPAFTNANLIQEPIYETRWLQYTGAAYGSGGSLGTFAQDTTSFRYRIRNFDCSFQATARVTNKGSWSGEVRITMPISAKATLQDLYFASGWVANNTNPLTTSRGGIKLGATNYMTVISNIFNAVLQWTAVVNNDSYWINGEYEI
jgi:hypothetical protein